MLVHPEIFLKFIYTIFTFLIQVSFCWKLEIHCHSAFIRLFHWSHSSMNKKKLYADKAIKASFLHQKKDGTGAERKPVTKFYNFMCVWLWLLAYIKFLFIITKCINHQFECMTLRSAVMSMQCNPSHRVRYIIHHY